MPVRFWFRPALVPLLLAALPAYGAELPPAWIGIGLNHSHVEDSEYDCLGAQIAVSVALPLLLRLYAAGYSYETDDDSNTCDAGVVGDSDAGEYALLLGWLLRNGIFAAAGPSKVDIENTFRGPWGQDTGTRIELGWTSRRTLRHFVGFDAVLFYTVNDVRDLSGLAFDVTFGGRP